MPHIHAEGMTFFDCQELPPLQHRIDNARTKAKWCRRLSRYAPTNGDATRHLETAKAWEKEVEILERIKAEEVS